MTRFAEIALAGHARAARQEMQLLAAGLLNLMGDAAGEDCRQMLQRI